jgi:hypothetical protein
MKTRVLCYGACLMLVLCLSVPCMAANVAQGKCITFDLQSKTVTIEEYDLNFSKENPYGKSTGKQGVYKLIDATLIGANPDPGNILRIAFEEKGGEKTALKIQNVTKQDIMKK